MQFFAKLHTFVQLWYRTSCQVMTPGTHLGSPRRLRMLVMMSHSISLFTTNDASVVRLSRSEVSTELSVEEEGATLVVTWGVEWNWPKWMWILCQGFVGQIQEGEVELQLVLSSQPDTASMIWLGLQSVCQDLATRNSSLLCCSCVMCPCDPCAGPWELNLQLFGMSIYGFPIEGKTLVENFPSLVLLPSEEWHLLRPAKTAV